MSSETRSVTGTIFVLIDTKFNSKDYERRNQRFTGARARTI